MRIKAVKHVIVVGRGPAGRARVIIEVKPYVYAPVFVIELSVLGGVPVRGDLALVGSVFNGRAAAVAWLESDGVDGVRLRYDAGRQHRRDQHRAEHD